MTINKAPVIGLLMVIAIGVGGYLAVSRVLQSKPELCNVCRRQIHPGHEYVVRLAGGKSEKACCPRCGMHFQSLNPSKVESAWASDFASGRLIQAENAFYVEGSDVMACCTAAPLREPGATFELHWDRCLPSLIAFKNEAEAKAFQMRHGGRLLAYSQSLENVRQK
jgi:hypothetical protein